METKLFILVLFGALLNISFANASCSSNSSNVGSIFCTIQRSERITYITYNDALTNVFNLVESLVEGSLNDRNNSEILANIQSIENRVTNSLSRAVQVTILAINTVNRVNITDLSAENAKIKKVVDGIIRAIISCTDSDSNAAKIRSITDEFTREIIQIYVDLFNLMRNGRKHHSAVLGAIKVVQTKAVKTIELVFGAIADGILVLQKISSSSSNNLPNGLVLVGIELLRRLAVTAANDVTDTIYQLLRTIAISTAAGAPQVASQFEIIEISEENVATGWVATLQPIGYLLRTIYNCSDVTLATEDIKDQVVYDLKSAISDFVNAVEILRNRNSAAIDIRESAIHEKLDGLVQLILDSVIKSRSSYASKNLADIKANRQAAISGFSEVLTDLFAIFGRAVGNRSDVASEVVVVRDLAIDSATEAVTAIFGVIIYIAEHSEPTDAASIDLYTIVVDAADLLVLIGLQGKISLTYGLVRSVFIQNYLCVYGFSIQYCIDRYHVNLI